MKRSFLSALLIVIAALGAQAQIFYKVEGNGLQKPSYIFGTHHFASETMLDSLPQVNEALKQVDCVVGELVFTDDQMAMVNEMQPHMIAPADSTLSRLIPADKFEKADSVFASLTGGMSLRMFETMKPAVSEMTVAAVVAANEMPQQGSIDQYFQKVAHLDSLKVAGLETADFQAYVLFDIIPLDRQAQSFIRSLEDPDKILESSRELTNAYLSRNADAIWKVARECNDESEGEFFEILLDKRNEAWLAKLPDMMKDEPLFVAVGALHLYGDGGLVEGLRKLGYTVTPIL